MMTEVQAREARNVKPARLYVKQIMEERGINAKAISEQTGVAYNTVVAYRDNRQDRITLRVLTQIAQVLGVEVWKLFRDPDEGEESS